MRDFRIFCQVQQTTSLKQEKLLAILLQRKKLLKVVFKADYLLQFSAAHNTSKY